MEIENINTQLELFILKNELVVKFNTFLKLKQTNSCLIKIIDLLKLKYPEPNDFNFIEQTICQPIYNSQYKFTNDNDTYSSMIIANIHNCTNNELIGDLYKIFKFITITS
jgi:hypothetical protein